MHISYKIDRNPPTKYKKANNPNKQLVVGREYVIIPKQYTQKFKKNSKI